jgi:hypothetical protein
LDLLPRSGLDLAIRRAGLDPLLPHNGYPPPFLWKKKEEKEGGERNERKRMEKRRRELLKFMCLNLRFLSGNSYCIKFILKLV